MRTAAAANWLKEIKLISQGEFVICGYALGEREHFGSLVLWPL